MCGGEEAAPPILRTKPGGMRSRRTVATRDKQWPWRLPSIAKNSAARSRGCVLHLRLEELTPGLQLSVSEHDSARDSF